MDFQGFNQLVESDEISLPDSAHVFGLLDDLLAETGYSTDVFNFIGAPLPLPKRHCIRPNNAPLQPTPKAFNALYDPRAQTVSSSEVFNFLGARNSNPLWQMTTPWLLQNNHPYYVPESQVLSPSVWSHVIDPYLSPRQGLKSGFLPLDTTPKAPSPPEKKPYSVSQKIQSAVGPVTITFQTPQPLSCAPAHSTRNKRAKNAQCQLCSKRFESRYKLRAHMNTHTGSRPFVCDVCGDAFMRSSTLAAHRRSHEKGKFSCPTCSRTFKRAPERLIHILLRVCTRKHRILRKTTTGWHCDSCGKYPPVPEGHLCASQANRTCPVCGMDFSGLRDHKLLSHVRSYHPDYLQSL